MSVSNDTGSNFGSHLKRWVMSASILGLVMAGPAVASDLYADPVAGDGPALYAVKDDDTTVYLFGTFHLLPTGTQWRTAAFDDAMARTGQTYVEADVLSPDAQAEIGAVVAQLGLNPDGVTLSETLGADRAARFETLLAAYGVPISALEQMRPWLAVLSLTTIAYGQAGLDPAQGVEHSVLAQAATEGDSLGYLETATFQIETLAALDEEELLAGFDQNLGEIVELETLMLEGVEAWRVGDVAQLDALLIEESRRSAPGVYEAVFTQRNANWTDQIVAKLDQDEDAFLAVGAGHLYGPGSVIELLDARGVEIERIQ